MSRILLALRRARSAILLVTLVNLVGVATGLVLVHAGNSIALDARDGLIARARASDPALASFDQGESATAALLDFGSNVGLAAVPATIAGISVVLPFPIVVYRGWVGGVVGVRDDHSSRLDEPRSAAYYLSVLTLQTIPYCLTVGAGVALGVATLRRREGRRLFGVPVFVLPRDSLADVAWIYVLAIPLFLIASLWEFLSPL
jgi:hypothetical protein